MADNSKFKTPVLLSRIAKYDEKYYNAIMKPRQEMQWGYNMRAYHRTKMSNPPEWKIKDKATLITEELIKRNVSFSTVYLNLKHVSTQINNND